MQKITKPQKALIAAGKLVSWRSNISAARMNRFLIHCFGRNDLKISTAIFVSYHNQVIKLDNRNMDKERIDLLLVELGLAESRSQAQRLIMAGEVLADDQLVYKPSQVYSRESRILIKNKPRYVSRGGLKLEKGLEEFGFSNLEGKVCVDVGASTGGFTDCLLQHGAKKYTR